MKDIKVDGVELRTRYTKATVRQPVIKRQAFLDDLANESFEDPYEFSSIDEAIAHLSKKFKLSISELVYLRKKAKTMETNWVKTHRS